MTSWQTYLQSLNDDDRALVNAALKGQYCPACGEKDLIIEESRSNPSMAELVSCRQCPFDTHYPATWPNEIRTASVDDDIHRLIGENGQ